jgi:hypothetical protein
MKKNTRSYLTIFILFFCASKAWVFGQEETHKLFKHSFTHLNQKGADDYLIEKTGIKKYSEWQNPPITYYGPSANAKESKLTYKYSFSGRLESAKVKISLATWNFNAGGAMGRGSGSASAWASNDGETWINLIDIPTPTKLSQGKTFNEFLPASLLGKKDLFLQIRLKVAGAPNSSYTVAQFGRADASSKNEIFSIEASYSDSVNAARKNKLSLKEGLVAWYPFDGNASDRSGNDNHGTVHGATLGKDRYGKDKRAYLFDGDDYIEVKYNKIINPSEFTVSLWVNPNIVNGPFNAGEGHYMSPLTSRDDFPTRGFIIYKNPLGKWNFGVGKSNYNTGHGWQGLSTDDNAEPNRWVHLAFSFKPSNLSAFLEGISIGTKNALYSVNQKRPLRIGAGMTERLSPNFFFVGSIDDVRIYNRALSEEEVLALYELESTNPNNDRPTPPLAPGTGGLTPPDPDYKDTIAELMRLLAEKDKKLAHCEKEIEVLNEEVTGLGKQVTSLDTNNKELKEQIQNLREDNQNLNYEITVTNEHLQKAIRVAETPFINGWVYDPERGWLFTDADRFPLIYAHKDQTWHYYELGSSKPRYFFNYKTQEWVAWDAIPSESDQVVANR